MTDTSSEPPPLPPKSGSSSPKPPPVGKSTGQEAAQAFLGKSKDLAKQLGATAKSAGLLAAKQAERTKIQNVNLPKAYTALGKHIYSEGKFRDDFPDTYRQLDDLHNKIAELETVSEPTGEKLSDKAKAAAVSAKRKAEAKALLLKVSRCHRTLGTEAFGRHGKESGPETLVQQIETHLRRSDLLDNEIQELSDGQTATGGAPIWMRKCVTIGCSGCLVFFALFVLLMLIIIGVVGPENMGTEPYRIDTHRRTVAAGDAQQEGVEGKHAELITNDADAREKKWGFIDTTGAVVIDCLYEAAGRFSEGRANVKVNGKWGFIDTQGQICIEPQFETVHTCFSEGIAIVGTEEAPALGIDRQGEAVFPYLTLNGERVYRGLLEFDSFNEGMSIVTDVANLNDQRLGAINKQGRFIVWPEDYWHMSRFRSGRSIVWADDGRGFSGTGVIDQNGRFVVPLTSRYHIGGDVPGRSDEYKEGMVIYHDTETGVCGFLDTEGRAVIPAESLQAGLSTPGVFSEGLAAVQRGEMIQHMHLGAPPDSGKYGYIDKSGKWAIRPQFAQAGRFSDGLAEVQIKFEGDFGYIDRTGSVVIEPQFEDAERFVDGAAFVRIDDLWGLIDKSGRFLCKPQFDEVGSDWWRGRVGLCDGVAFVKKDDLWGVIDKTGRIVVEPRFVEVARTEMFSEGLAAVRQP